MGTDEPLNTPSIENQKILFVVAVVAAAAEGVQTYDQRN